VGILEEVKNGTYDYKVEDSTDGDGVSWIKDTCTQIHGVFVNLEDNYKVDSRAR